MMTGWKERIAKLKIKMKGKKKMAKVKESYVKKSIKVTVLNGTRFFMDKDGNPQSSPIKDFILVGQFTPDQATQYLAGKFGKETAVIIKDAKTEVRNYRISYEKFVNIADDITPTAKPEKK